MQKTELKHLFKDKLFLKKLSSAVVVLGVFAVLFLINILADKLPWSYDMTNEKIFTLSEQTQTVLDDLSDDVNVVAFYEEGAEDQTVQTLLDEYKKHSRGLINVEYVDADKNPAVVKRFDKDDEGISNGTVVFESHGQIKQVSQFDIYILNDLAYGKAFNGEQQFTGAIIHVTSDDLPKVYFLEGNRESAIDDNLSKLAARIEGEAHVVEQLNLLLTGTIPEDADTIVVASPKTDLSDDEKDLLKQYLFEGGRMIILFDIIAKGENMSNFNSLLRSYGVQYSNNFVVEEDSSSFYASNKMFLIPLYNIQHTIVEKLNADRSFVLLPFSCNIELLTDFDRTVTVDKLLISSEKSWIRYDIDDATATPTEADLTGPATLAVAINKDNTDLRFDETKLIVTGNAMFVDNEYIDTQGNFNFLMNAINWVEGKDDAIAIRPKSLNTNTMFVKGELYTVIMLVSVVVIPLAAFLAGVIVWLKRRHL